MYASITIAAVLAIILAIVEAALRVSYQKIERITGAAEWQVGQYGQMTYFWDEYHPMYGWTNRAGYRSDARVPFEVSINAQSLRGVEDYAPSAPAGIRRIAVFGDSVVFGEEVDDQATIPAFLERRLHNAQALNFGVHGYGLGQMMLRLEAEAFEFNPDHIVVVLLLPWDVYRDERPLFIHNKPYFGVDATELRIMNTPVPEASRQPWLLRTCFTAAWLFGRPGTWRKTQYLDEQLQITHAIIRRIDQACRRHGVPWTLVHLVFPGHLNMARSADAAAEDSPQRIDFMRKALLDRHADVDQLDAIEPMTAALAKYGPALGMPHGHYSPLGNCMIADLIADHLATASPDWSLNAALPTCEELRPASSGDPPGD